MIHKGATPATWDVTCDRCSAGEMTVKADEFTDAVRLIQADGWRVQKDAAGQWEHLCPDCVSARAANAVRGSLL